MTESDELAQQYIDYAKDDESLSGCAFSANATTITIYQETEEVDQDGENEEPSKYKILKSETDPILWKEIKRIALLHIIRANFNFGR